MLTLEINKNIELVQVLLYLSKCQERTIQQLNNTYYCKRISDFFMKYLNHAAVELTRSLIINSNFVHIKPLRAILNHDIIIKDSNNPLYRWAIEVDKFKEEVNFEQFFFSNKEYYDRILRKIKSYDIDCWVSYINGYFKQSNRLFNLIICPIAGNYGFVLDVPKPNTSYNVCCEPHYNESGNELWYKDFFVKGVAHEYAHCFINPVVESHKELLVPLKPFYEKHKNMLSFYNVDYAIMNEYWVRAFAIRFMEHNKDSFPEFNIKEEYDRQRKVFIYIDEFVEMLKIFEESNIMFHEFYLSSIEQISKLV